MWGGNREINKFLLKLFAAYFFWIIADNWLLFNLDFFSRVWSFCYHLFLTGVRSLSILFLNLGGYEIVNDYRSIAIIGSYGVIIGNHCVGFGISYAFAALIWAYPGPNKVKLWFIPAGIFLIMLLNTIRIVAISITGFNKGIFMQIEQHDFFNYVIYFVIFIIWLVWIKFILPWANQRK